MSTSPTGRSDPAAAAPPWYDQAFGPLYPDVYAHRDVLSAGREVAFALELGLGLRVLDLCCGFGRHAIHLSRAGLEVIGVDRSFDLLRLAQERVDFQSALRGRLVRADMSQLPFQDACFDSALNLFSSFGYLSEAEDRATLLELVRVLRPGGRALLDLMNPKRVRQGLVPRSERTGPGFFLLEQRRLEAGGKRVVKDVSFTPEGEAPQLWREVVRLYELDECLALLKSAGLELESAFGAFEHTPLTDDSPRMLLLAKRRA